jgi:hypothetical protein
MRKVWAFLKKELLEILPVWLFFLSAFALLRLTQTVTLSHFDVHRQTPSVVIIGSLIVAKTVLIADSFRFVELFEKKPLIYSTLWKAAIYWIGASILYFLEGLFELLHSGHAFAGAIRRLTAEFGEPRFLVLELWLAILLFAYCATCELIRSLGTRHFRELFFGRRLSTGTR